ncbi:tyrosine-type DNA invertase [Pluralibacter gergoviae]|uniref:tyrosine-type DNA invertase n=1 Tax=Pluralibacter gergoviae TaxID=61647 RepID=UPI0006AC609D|nr:tyrosine-type DNA invertase [Pluralibacter gergoviae]KOQ99596.1 tyrosine recombinase [Pluralibacter gergoviae]
MTKRRFLTQEEIGRMIQAVRASRTGERDACLILLAFRHGFRISELLGLEFRDLDLCGGRMSVRRLKNGFSTIHPLQEDECLALEEWIRVRDKWQRAVVPERVFISTRGTPLSRQQAWRIIRNSGEQGGISTETHPHMLRHACGYELAERGADTRLIQDYLGHRNIRHTVRYTASNAARFAGIWERENRLNVNLQKK